MLSGALLLLCCCCCCCCCCWLHSPSRSPLHCCLLLLTLLNDEGLQEGRGNNRWGPEAVDAMTETPTPQQLHTLGIPDSMRTCQHVTERQQAACIPLDQT
jgi:hypothetical protein